MHTPPLAHGFEEQTLIIFSQNWPLYPSLQLQTKELVLGWFEHEALLRHGANN